MTKNANAHAFQNPKDQSWLDVTMRFYFTKKENGFPTTWRISVIGPTWKGMSRKYAKLARCVPKQGSDANVLQPPSNRRKRMAC
jgi:hypothetical protein